LSPTNLLNFQQAVRAKAARQDLDVSEVATAQCIGDALMQSEIQESRFE
jgi:hypothetical protein